MTTREAFEAWICANHTRWTGNPLMDGGQCLLKKRSRDRYQAPFIEDTWAAWQASALETEAQFEEIKCPGGHWPSTDPHAEVEWTHEGCRYCGGTGKLWRKR